MLVSKKRRNSGEIDAAQQLIEVHRHTIYSEIEASLSILGASVQIILNAHLGVNKSSQAGYHIYLLKSTKRGSR